MQTTKIKSAYKDNYIDAARIRNRITTAAILDNPAIFDFLLDDKETAEIALEAMLNQNPHFWTDCICYISDNNKKGYQFVVDFFKKKYSYAAEVVSYVNKFTYGKESPVMNAFINDIMSEKLIDFSYKNQALPVTFFYVYVARIYNNIQMQNYAINKLLRMKNYRYFVTMYKQVQKYLQEDIRQLFKQKYVNSEAKCVLDIIN